MPLSERRIEAWVETATNALDTRYLTGRTPPEFLTTDQYTRGLRIIAQAAKDAALEPHELVALHTLDQAGAKLGSLGSVFA